MRLRSPTAAHRRRLGRPFTRLWVGFTLASSGDGMTYGAVPLLAVVVDPHPLAVSAVAAADSLPWLLVALPAGAFADRFERGPVMALANILRATAMLAAALLVVTDRITLAYLIIIVLVNAGGRAIYYSSLQAMVPGSSTCRRSRTGERSVVGYRGGRREPWRVRSSEPRSSLWADPCRSSQTPSL